MKELLKKFGILLFGIIAVIFVLIFLLKVTLWLLFLVLPYVFFVLVVAFVWSYLSSRKLKLKE